MSPVREAAESAGKFWKGIGWAAKIVVVSVLTGAVSWSAFVTIRAFAADSNTQHIQEAKQDIRMLEQEAKEVIKQTAETNRSVQKLVDAIEKEREVFRTEKEALKIRQESLDRDIRDEESRRQELDSILFRNLSGLKSAIDELRVETRKVLLEVESIKKDKESK